jgi:hypothetical protein
MIRAHFIVGGKTDAQKKIVDCLKCTALHIIRHTQAALIFFFAPFRVQNGLMAAEMLQSPHALTQKKPHSPLGASRKFKENSERSG